MTLFTLVTWSIFGGAISRRVVVQLATGEKIFATEALGFTFRHLGAYLTAPLIPLGIVAIILLILFLFGIGHMIPWLGDIVVSGLFWPVPLILGLIMTILLVGLVAWPLMAATISADGSDGWEAFTRAYGCLLERPWHCAWYSLVAIAYGGVVIFFVGFISSMMVYLGDWGVNAAPATMAESRETSFLFVHAPKSFGWRELLMEGTQVKPTPAEIERDKSLADFNGADVVHGRGDRSPPASAQVGGVNPIRPHRSGGLRRLPQDDVVVEQGRRVDGRVLAGAGVPARPRLRVRAVLDDHVDHLPAPASRTRRVRDGRRVHGARGVQQLPHAGRRPDGPGDAG